MLISRPPIGDWLYKVVTSAVVAAYSRPLLSPPGLDSRVGLRQLGNQILRVLVQIAAAAVRRRKTDHYSVADGHVSARILHQSGSRRDRHHPALVIAEGFPIVRMRDCERIVAIFTHPAGRSGSPD